MAGLIRPLFNYWLDYNLYYNIGSCRDGRFRVVSRVGGGNWYVLCSPQISPTPSRIVSYSNWSPNTLIDSLIAGGLRDRHRHEEKSYSRVREMSRSGRGGEQLEAQAMAVVCRRRGRGAHGIVFEEPRRRRVGSWSKTRAPSAQPHDRQRRRNCVTSSHKRSGTERTDQVESHDREELSRSCATPRSSVVAGMFDAPQAVRTPHGRSIALELIV